VLVSVGGTGAGAKVYLSENATDDTPVFNPKQGNLPQGPVYATLIEMNNSNYAMIGNEFGVWFTENLNAAAPTWYQLRTGINANVPVFHIVQQIRSVSDTYYHFEENGVPGSLFYPGTNNTGIIYIGTHGKGIFRTSKFYVETPSTTGIPEYFAYNQKLSVYPNPASTYTNLEFKLATDENLKAQIYDITGKLVKIIQIEARQGDNTAQINCDDLKAGIYMINLTSKTVNLSSKLVIRK